MQATTTLKAWKTCNWRDLDWYTERLQSGSKGAVEEALGSMMYTNSDMSDCDGWAEIGIAQVSVVFHPREDIATKELDILNKKLQEVRAENQQRENAILERISKLQAITYLSEAS